MLLLVFLMALCRSNCATVVGFVLFTILTVPGSMHPYALQGAAENDCCPHPSHTQAKRKLTLLDEEQQI